MRFLRSKKILWIGLPVILFGGFTAFFVLRGPEGPQFVTETVRRETLVQTVDATGSLEALEQADLSFSTGGIVTQVFVDTGDEVQAEALLFGLDAGEALADLSRVSQVFNAARALLEQKQAGATVEARQTALASVAVAEAQVQSSELALEQAETAHAQELAQARADLEEASDALVITLRDSTVTVRDVLSDADEILGVENTSANDAYETFLSFSHPDYLRQAREAFRQAKQELVALEPLLFPFPSASSSFVHSSLSSQTSTLIRDTAETVRWTRLVLDESTLHTSSFTPQDAATKRATMDAARVSVEADLATLVSSQASYATTERALDALLLAPTIATAEAALEVSHSQAEEAHARLAEVEASVRALDLAPFEADLYRTAAELDAAQIRVNAKTLRAPFAGVVTDIFVDIGEYAAPGTPILTLRNVDPRRFEMTVPLSETDSAKVHVGDNVEAIFDAFGRSRILTGHVISLDPAGHEIEGVVYFDASILLDLSGEEMALRPGLSAQVTITTAIVEDVLSVSSRAVLEKEGQLFVRVLEGDVMVEKNVRIGLRGDAGRVEILEGIREGDIVVVSEKKP